MAKQVAALKEKVARLQSIAPRAMQSISDAETERDQETRAIASHLAKLAADINELKDASAKVAKAQAVQAHLDAAQLNVKADETRRDVQTTKGRTTWAAVIVVLVQLLVEVVHFANSVSPQGDSPVDANRPQGAQH